MTTFQDLQFELQDNVYSILGYTTKEQFEREIYNIVLGECVEVVLRNKEDVQSILTEYGVMKAILNWNKQNEPLDYEGDRDWVERHLLMDVLRQETVFCYEDYSQRYELEETSEEIETTN
jgi:hypothetical protein